MLPASNRGAGQNLCFPDVCLTPAPPAPPVPIPYPNIAMNCQATGFAPNVKVSGMNALNLGSRIPVTMGDEAGAAHPTKKGGAGYTMGNPVVSINKLPAINLTCPTNGNNMNAPLGAVLVPSAVNVLYCRADLALTAGLSGEVLHALGDAAAGRGAGDRACDAAILAGEVGVMRLASFPTHAGTMVHAALRRLTDRGARAVVLDLRGNPGGDLEAAVAVAGELLPTGSIVARLVVDGDVEILSTRGPDGDARPLAVLIDGRTASAAEILARALAAHGRAQLFGERTYGKWTAQALHAGRDGSSADYATVAAVHAPDGSASTSAGLAPHVACSSAEAMEGARAALERAVREGALPEPRARA